MVQNNTVSIITPFYKGNKYLEQLLQTVEKNCANLQREMPAVGIELILVNDSPQTSVEIPEGKWSFPIKILKHEKNSGIHQARVTGLQNCNGNFIQFLDQDDVLTEDAIVSQLNVLLPTSADMVVSNGYMETSKGSLRLLYQCQTQYERICNLEYYLKSHNAIKSPGQCLIRRKSIPMEWEKYIMETNGSDDLFLWILMCERSVSIIINKRELYIHKYTGENLSESECKMNDSTLEFANILSNISYVSPQHIKELKQSREFRQKFHQVSLIEKIKLCSKNVKLLQYLVKNKIKNSL